MSTLPEQRKTPEEIAALRGQLGIPTVVPEVASVAEVAPEPPPVATLSPAPAETIETPIDPETGLPFHRHSDDELERLRRRGMFETQDGALQLPVRRARSWMVVCGYLFAASAAIPVYHSLPIVLPLAIALLSLAFGAFLYFLRPYSKHHGAFIAVVVFFVLTYAALQYFPQLRHAT